MQIPNSILIVKLSAIGDVVHSIPVLEILRENFPSARIDWLIEEEAYGIIHRHTGIDHVYVSRRKSWQRRLLKGGERRAVIREIVRFMREIRSIEYDMVIDLHGLFKSGILTGLARGKRKIGMSGATEGGWLFLNERPIPVDYNQHAIDRYLKVPEYLECDLVSWKGDIEICEPDKKFIDRLFSSNGLSQRPVVAINPMARWDTKLWEPERFALLADRIRNELGCHVLFTGSKEDRAIIEDMSQMMEHCPFNVAGRTSLKELAYLYTRCPVLITTDTGPMHIAAAMGCHVVALFGPTAPWRTGPYGDGHRIIRAGVECSPCFKKKCDHMSCMKKISVDAAFDAVKQILLEKHVV